MGLVRCLMGRIVIREFQDWQVFGPGVTILVYKVLKHLLDRFIHVFRLAVRLWMERCSHRQLCSKASSNFLPKERYKNSHPDRIRLHREDRNPEMLDLRTISRNSSAVIDCVVATNLAPFVNAQPKLATVSNPSFDRGKGRIKSVPTSP
jgi:hypothetical protein